MDNMIGRRFHIDQIEYSVVDVRNMSGETLVYAEPSTNSERAVDGTDEGARVAIRSVDLVPLLERSESAHQVA